MDIIDIYKGVYRDGFERLSGDSITCDFEYRKMVVAIRYDSNKYVAIKGGVIFTEDRVIVDVYDTTWNQYLESFKINTNMVFYCPFTSIVITANLYDEERSVVFNRTYGNSFSLLSFSLPIDKIG